jgi:hypothetical protein
MGNKIERHLRRHLECLANREQLTEVVLAKSPVDDCRLGRSSNPPQFARFSLCRLPGASVKLYLRKWGPFFLSA